MSMTTLTSNFSNISFLKMPQNKDIAKETMIHEQDDEQNSGSGANYKRAPSHEKSFSNTQEVFNIPMQKKEITKKSSVLNSQIGQRNLISPGNG